jgi:cob(I)alamin adenosyltransferase
MFLPRRNLSLKVDILPSVNELVLRTGEIRSVIMKIYTRGGDKGFTSLLGGIRVPKNDPRVEAYGTIDEVISWLGLIRDQEECSDREDLLIWIQDRLMVGTGIVASEEGTKREIPSLTATDIERLEQEIDTLQKELPPLSSFILPGGNKTSSYCQVCRSVCRRAERMVVPVAADNPDLGLVLKFLNRLADLLFVFARYILSKSGGQEIKWNA